MSVTSFDAFERLIWAGRAEAFAGSFAQLCAHPVPRLLDAAGVREGVGVLDVGTGTGTVAAAACDRGATVTAVDAEPSMVELAAKAAPAAEVRLAVLPVLPFEDGTFDAVVGNFVLNHVGHPGETLAELRRVVRPGGRLALTIWTNPGAPGQTLLGRAVEAAGVQRPAHLPVLAPEDDFPRSPQGLVDLVHAAGFSQAQGETLRWDHRVEPEVWWSGPASGVAFLGQIVTGQPEEVRAEIKRQFDVLCTEFAGPDGRLVLPHQAVLVGARR